MHQTTLHRASWVVPVTDPVIKDGAVVVQNEQIVAVGTFADLRSKYHDAAIIDHTNCALSPALINTHIHLELSHLPIPDFKENVIDFTDWIETLLAMREKHGTFGREMEDAAETALMSQYELGVAALGDIGNTDIGDKLRDKFPGKLIHFNEHLGRSKKTRRSILERVDKSPQEKIHTAHAPYSTHPELIQKLKERAAANNQPFSIHVAEPSSENELLCCGTGTLHTFLKERGFIDDSYTPPAGMSSLGSVQYLYNLGILDKLTICVHCIHVTPEEVEILSRTGTNICLCPGSNRYLRVGKPPVALFLKAGILPALGTDSIASNPELSLWREMKILAEDNPDIDPAQIFAMATLGGAKALNIDNNYGSLERGKSTRFLAIPLQKDITNETMLYTHLVQHKDFEPTWVNE